MMPRYSWSLKGATSHLSRHLGIDRLFWVLDSVSEKAVETEHLEDYLWICETDKAIVRVSGCQVDDKQGFQNSPYSFFTFGGLAFSSVKSSFQTLNSPNTH